MGHGGADVSFAFRLLECTFSFHFGARQAYDWVPDPGPQLLDRTFVTLGPSDLKLVYIPTPEVRKSITDWA